MYVHVAIRNKHDCHKQQKTSATMVRTVVFLFAIVGAAFDHVIAQPEHLIVGGYVRLT